jgi:choline dehydrogenase-like flavoprotein
MGDIDFRCATVVVWQIGTSPNTPGYSLHETGTLRRGDDPTRFVTNKFGQTHDVPTLFVCGASLFLGCSDKTTTLSILAFSLRAREYLIESLKTGHV